MNETTPSRPVLVYPLSKRSDLNLLGSFGTLLGGLGWEQLGEDVWQDTTLGDDDGTEEFVELFVVSDGELQVSWDDTGLLVVSGSVTGELKDLGSEV